MRKGLFLFLLFSFSTIAYSQIILNEFETTGLERIELKNISNQTVDVNSFILCSYPVYNQIANLNIISGNYLMAPGDIVVVNGHPLGDTDGELAIYLNYNFTTPNAIIDYVEWGSSFHVRATIAVQAGIWIAGDFVPSPPANVSLEYDGMGDASTNWHVQMSSTFGMENGILSVASNEFSESLSISYSQINNLLSIASANQNYPISGISLSDLSGKLMLQKELSDVNQWQLDAGQLTEGVYLVRVSSQDKFITKKLIIF